MARILVNQSAQTENGDRLANALIGLITNAETLKRLKLVADANVIDPQGTPDYSEVEAEFGLAAGTGAAFYALLAAGVAALDDADVGAMLVGIGRR